MMPLMPRATLAFLVFAFWCAPAWSAPASDSSPWNLAFQVGGVNHGDDGTGPMGTMTVSWTGWSLGGLWGEFGVLNPKGGNGLTSSDAILNTGHQFNSQYLAVSAGFMLGGIREPLYFKLGLGVYRYDSDQYERRWLPAGSIGLGALIGPSTLHTRPMLEARLHLPSDTNQFSDDAYKNAMVSFSGGVWFH